VSAIYTLSWLPDDGVGGVAEVEPRSFRLRSREGVGGWTKVPPAKAGGLSTYLSCGISARVEDVVGRLRAETSPRSAVGWP